MQNFFSGLFVPGGLASTAVKFLKPAIDGIKETTDKIQFNLTLRETAFKAGNLILKAEIQKDLQVAFINIYKGHCQQIYVDVALQSNAPAKDLSRDLYCG